MKLQEDSFIFHYDCPPSSENLMEVLSSFCGRVRKLAHNSSTNPLKVAFHGFPGGAEAFELMTKFCYDDGRTRVTPANTCLLYSVAQFMEMTDCASSSSSMNLLELTEKSLEGIPYWSWPELVTCLKQCQDLFPVANSSVTLGRVLDSLVGRITAVTDASPPGSSPESSALRLSCDTRSTISAKNGSHRAWWFEDLVILKPEMIERIVKSMIFQKVDHALVTRFLVHYLKSVISNVSSDKRKAAEVIIGLLYSLDGNSVSCKVLFDVLRISAPLKLGKCCQIKLESMIGNKFDQATLDNLLVPAPAGMNNLYDVNLILRFLKFFLRRKVGDSSTQLKQAGRLMDSYLAEVAPDSSLKPFKFLALATALPDEARDSHDAIYRAIDMYLEVHTQLSEEEKTKLFFAVNYEKLSSESCKHLARNAKFPSRTAIRALISQQTKLRSLLKETNQLKKLGRKRNQRKKDQFISDDEPVVLYAKKLDLSVENEKLKTQLQGMQWKVMELEKVCRKMQAEMEKAMNIKNSRMIISQSGSRSLPRLCS
ncbi:hypothetical protein Cni_G26891 [Canna indica]|uniref:NPH3 domain-containing protein n=1 Tax=Canna indica TaxID=4628 RepID=A0AAQ3L3Y7_9LILI|nr:hypothetical protein Cni_G26891 [Canna indica]